jgi:uncharacterized protein YidB (DUF937 family)
MLRFKTVRTLVPLRRNKAVTPTFPITIRGNVMSLFRSPLLLALAGVLAYRTLRGKGRLASILGMGEGDTSKQAPEATSVPGSHVGGWLSNILGGGAISTGLQDLIDRFREKGHGETADSWVSTGPNRSISPPHFEETLGNERIEWLMQQTGMSREELLSGLSSAVPETVDTLTPDGRIPTPDEAAHLPPPPRAAA